MLIDSILGLPFWFGSILFGFASRNSRIVDGRWHRLTVLDHLLQLLHLDSEDENYDIKARYSQAIITYA